MLCDYQDELTYTAGPPATSKQSIVGVAGTIINGGKVKDGGAAGDWGAGEVMKAVLRVVTAVVGATGGIKFDIVTSAAATLTSPQILVTKTIPTASLAINTVHVIGTLPSSVTAARLRYLGSNITPLATNTTAGEVIIELVPADDASPQNRVNQL